MKLILTAGLLCAALLIAAVSTVSAKSFDTGIDGSAATTLIGE